MDHKIKFLIFLSCLYGIAFGDPMPVRDCGTKGVTLNSFDIGGCTKFPCVFNKNQNGTLVLNVTSGTSYKSLTNVVYGVIAGVKVPFPLPQSNACTNGVSCPINQGATFTETIIVPILSIYPSIPVVVQFQLNDDAANIALCVTFPVLIK